MNTKAFRVLSGEYKQVKVICPSCNRERYAEIEVEHLESPEAWRINGSLVVTCESCKSRRENA